MSISKSLQRFNYIYLVTLLTLGVLFYDFIQKAFGFAYIDEILFVVIFLSYLSKGRITREFMFFVAVALFYLLNSFRDPHNVTQAILIDFVIQIKPFVAFYAVYNMNFSINDWQRKKICNFCKISAVCLLPIGIFGIGGVGIMNEFGGHARFATMLTILGLTYLVYSEQKKRDLIISFLICGIGLLSLRSKMFGFYTAFVCIMILWKNVNLNKVISFKNLLLAIAVLVLILFSAQYKIQFYFVDGTEARNMFARPLLYMKSWEILNDFPFFGTGFGSYATHASSAYYSPLYIDYDLYLSPEIGEGLFISDTFFPVFAQFGFVGLALFVWFWVRRMKCACRHLELYGNIVYFKLTILILIFFFIESVADSTFTHNRGMVMMILLGVILNNRYEKVLCGRRFREPDSVSSALC